MTRVVIPQSPNLKTRAARQLLPVLFGATRLVRRPSPPPGPVRVVRKEYQCERHGFFIFGSSRSAPQLNADILDFLESVDPNFS